MTEATHPLTPPPELYQQWCSCGNVTEALNQASQWGADQELEACCKWLERKGFAFVDEIRAERRPKPLSLKEQALALIDECTDPKGDYLDDNALATIRRALEQLPDND